MKRLLLLGSLITLLTGCSELKVIGGAALNELSAEAIAVNAGQEFMPEFRTKKQTEKAILLAMVEKKSAAWEEKKRLGKKGLWEQ